MRAQLAVAGAVAALAMLAPVQAEAQNFHFQCPGCTTVGGGPTVFSDDLYMFTVDADGSYDLYAAGTATGTFDVTVYTDEGAVVVETFNYFVPDPNSNAFFGTVDLVAGTTYYIGAAGGDCTTGQGCNLEIKMQEGGTPPPSTVPEPATMILLGSGLAGVLGARRRRKQQD